jgi:hypothetical protein
MGAGAAAKQASLPADRATAGIRAFICRAAMQLTSCATPFHIRFTQQTPNVSSMSNAVNGRKRVIRTYLRI